MKSIIAVTLFAFSFSTFAKTRAEHRVNWQNKRIEQGKESGQLNDKEAARLEKGQEHVGNVQEKAAADGVVTAGEKHRIEKAQDRQNRRIHKQKHDRQHR